MLNNAEQFKTHEGLMSGRVKAVPGLLLVEAQQLKMKGEKMKVSHFFIH